MEGRFLTEPGSVHQHNLRSLASQGPALVLGDGVELGFNTPMENYNNGDEMMVQYVGTQSCARITAGMWLLCGPTTNSVGTRLYNTHIFDVNDGADEVDLEISSPIGIYTSIANSHVRKSGAGTLRLKHGSNTFRGTTIIRNGRLLVASNVPKGGNSVLGNCTADVVIGDAGTQPGDAPTFVFEGSASRTFARGVSVGPCLGSPTLGSISNINATFSGALTLNSRLRLFSAS
ncbi:MAG: autotransporter-associated beta strand repeat-containing protein [Kiritimatiellae bacterium]|nr:autotransporter-associated beta strand repeat-containing protein [Kiritimatiellia bacterium]